MNVDELLSYTMTSDELLVWNEFTQSLKDEFLKLKKIYSLEIPNYEESIMDMMDYVVPFVGRKGYIEGSGFYFAIEEDRGRRAEVRYANKSATEHRTIMAKEISNAIAYEYAVKQKSALIKKHGHLWKSIESYECPEGVSQVNDNYIYPLKFDYRKYWFEIELLLDKYFLDRDDFAKTVKMRVYDLNCPFLSGKSKLRWVYSEENKEFDLLQ